MLETCFKTGSLGFNAHINVLAGGKWLDQDTPFDKAELYATAVDVLHQTMSSV